MTKKTKKNPSPKKSKKAKKSSSPAKKKGAKTPAKKTQPVTKKTAGPPPKKKTEKTPAKKTQPVTKKTARPSTKKKTEKKPAKKTSPVQKKETVNKTTESRSSSNINHRKRELQKIREKEKEEKMILKSMKGKIYCVVENCDYPAIVEDYCRIHFFGLFKYIQKKKKILEQDLLIKSYQSLVEKYSPAILEYLLKDLSSEKNFKSALKKIIE